MTIYYHTVKEGMYDLMGGQVSYEKFEKLTKEKSTSAYQVSKETGVPRSTFTRWKNGTCFPKYDKIKRISGYFGVTADYFYD